MNDADQPPSTGISAAWCDWKFWKKLTQHVARVASTRNRADRQNGYEGDVLCECGDSPTRAGKHTAGPPAAPQKAVPGEQEGLGWMVISAIVELLPVP